MWLGLIRAPHVRSPPQLDPLSTLTGNFLRRSTHSSGCRSININLTLCPAYFVLVVAISISAPVRIRQKHVGDAPLDRKRLMCTYEVPFYARWNAVLVSIVILWWRRWVPLAVHLAQFSLIDT